MRFLKVLFLIVSISFLLIACGSKGGGGGDAAIESGEVSDIVPIVCELPEETYQVVTIYFAGTGMTEEWWDPSSAVGSLG